MQLAVEAGRGEGAEVRALADRVARRAGHRVRLGAPRSLDGSTWQIEAIARGDAAAEPARQAVESIRAYDTPFAVAGGRRGGRVRRPAERHRLVRWCPR